MELSDYHIVRWVGDTLGRHYPLPALTVEAGGYVVVTKNRASVLACYHVERPEWLVECQLPTLPNNGGVVVLARADSSVVEQMPYSPAMHSDLLRSESGVALERRSFEQPADVASNWFSAASTVGYGTPTAPNSQSREWLATETSFELQEPLLSPDGDGYQDEMHIHYRLNADGLAARAEVMDRHGMRVRRLLDGDLMGTAGDLVWDGRDERGGVVSAGQYVVLITLYDSRGTQQTLRRVVAVVSR